MTTFRVTRRESRNRPASETSEHFLKISITTASIRGRVLRVRDGEGLRPRPARKRLERRRKPSERPIVASNEGNGISIQEPGASPERPRAKVPFDLVVAGLALLISALATAAGWWQTHVIAQQLSAQVWPYVTVAGNFDGAGDVKLSVDNDGMGPAIVESFVLLIDGKPQRDVIAAMHALVGSIKRRDPHADLDVSSIAAGQVLRTNSATLLFRLRSKALASELAGQMSRRLTIETCYCSIVDNCWTFEISATNPVERPVPISHCRDAGASQLQAPTPSEMQNPTL